jgi:sterol desaturase/sphingolipid hydroxylase (fatty acid hydroxylase superfamily)
MSNTNPNFQEAHSPDLFKSPLLNRLTRTHISIPVTVFFLYAGGLLYYTQTATELTLGLVIFLFLSGTLLFTFAEYAIHRWVYHPPENASAGHRNFTYKIHGVHHDHPKDKQRLAMPPVLSVVVSTLLLVIFRVIMHQYAFAFTAGFLVGYALYLLIHYIIHMYRAPQNIFKALWVNHSIHHYSEDEILFGVSTPLWDYIFGTLPKKKPLGERKTVVK